MITIVSIAAPEAVKGFTSRYLIEVSSSLFVGTLSAKVRDNLWSFIEDNIRSGRAVMMYNTNSAQGYEILATKSSSRELVEPDGVTLVKQLHSENKSMSKSSNVVGKSGWSKLSYQRKGRKK